MSTNPSLEIYGDEVLDVLMDELAPLKAFTRDLSPIAAYPGESVMVGVSQEQTAGDFNATSNNYGANDDDLAGVSVTFNKRKLSKFGISDEKAMNYPESWWRTKGQNGGKAVAEACLSDVMSVFTAANFGSGANDRLAVPLAGFGKEAVAGIRAAAIKKKIRPARATLLLHPDYYSVLLGTLSANEYGSASAIQDGVLRKLLGFRQIIECWQLKQPGVVLLPDAVTFLNRWLKPIKPEAYQAAFAQTDDETGLTIGIREFEDPHTGVLSVSAELAYGYAVGNNKAVLRLIDGPEPAAAE